MKDHQKNLIRQNKPLKEALKNLNNAPDTLTLFVLNEIDQLVGTLTDGDVRRGLLKNLAVNAPVEKFMFRDFNFLKQNNYDLNDIRRLRDKRIRLLPILDDQHRIIRIIDFSKKRSSLPIDAVLMAGGKGTRLRPLTLNTPKPLLKVGDKPILEYNIDRLNLYGIYSLFIIINYLGQQISDYFGDGKEKGMNINYVKEEKPLGTLGAVADISDFRHNYILIMNSDILTNIDYEDFFRELIEKNGDMIVATTSFKVKVPYGVIETKDSTIINLEEKPTYTYYSNAGIYIFKREFANWIPKNQHFNATDLIESLIKKGKKVIHYPILGYWLDIGKPADFEKAQDDIKHIQF